MPRKDYPLSIPVANLRPGLTVWKEDGNRLVRDVYLRDYFYGSYSPREWMRRVQFHTASDAIVVWRISGNVLVTVGKDDRKIITRKGY